MIAAVTNHLWQSTVFAALAGLLTLAFRRNAARVRYWLWLAASLKFLLPFALLIALGSHIPWRLAEPKSQFAVSQIGLVRQPFRAAAALPRGAIRADQTNPEPLLIALWALGFTIVTVRYCTRWHRLHNSRRRAAPLPLHAPIPILASPTSLEPGVFGIFRPVMLLPEGLPDRLTPAQFKAILAHELTHVRARDNLTAALHMLVEAIFWFHPLVWWLGARLIAERERACDEAVCATGSDHAIYAEAILNVCRFYVESPLACACGVTGADLTKRIEEIMTRRVVNKLQFGKKLLFALAGILAITVPVIIGVLNAPPSRAQSPGPRPSFEVASVKPGDPSEPRFSILLRPGGRFTAQNATLMELIGYAYDLRQNQITGGATWLNSDKYGIEARPDATFPVPTGQIGAMKIRLMLQSLLAERFKLAVHMERKEQPVFNLLLAKGGPKLKEVADSDQNGERVGRGEITGSAIPISLLIKPLSQVLGRTIIDHTGLTRKYDFTLKWTPESGQGPFAVVTPTAETPTSDPNFLSIFTALEDQLGLKLESAKGPVDALVIDHVERPSEN